MRRQTATPSTPERTAGRSLPPETKVVLAAVAVLVAVGTAQLSDLLTFIRMITLAGTAAELNPLVAHGAETLGYLPLIAAKIALIVLVASVFAIVARSRRGVAAFVATAGTAAGLIGAYSNLFAIV